MQFFRSVFDWMFAPSCAFDDSSDAFATDRAVGSAFETGSSAGARPGSHFDTPVFNPTTGLEMMGGIGGVDVGGHTWCEPATSFSSDPFPNHASYWDSSPSHDFSTGIGGAMDFGCTSHAWEP